MSALPARLVQRPQALLLDAGDTIVFLDADAVSAVLQSRGVTLAAEAIAGAIQPAKRDYQQVLSQGGRHEDGWTALVYSLLGHAGLATELAAPHLDALRQAHDDFYFWRRVPAGLVNALGRARAGGIRLGVISNSEGRLASVFERLGILDQFEIVLDSRLEGVEKPAPEIFRRALARMGVAAERSVYAGDIPEVDVDGAEAVGMHGVLVDAFDQHAGRSIPRVASVAELVDALLTLPV